jgi:hypothetical protein
LVERYCGPDEVLERRLIEAIALPEVDGAGGLRVQAGVEQVRRILERGAPEEVDLQALLERSKGNDIAAA